MDKTLKSKKLDSKKNFMVMKSTIKITIGDKKYPKLNVVKGFISLDTPDRSNDLARPWSFNLDRFKANPVVMYNHMFWKTADGNSVPVGKNLDLYVAKVVDIFSDTEWGIQDVISNDITDTIAKDRSPDLKVGDTGLWAVTEITVDEVWKQIEDGTLNAFSWRGLGQEEEVNICNEYSCNTVNELYNIDLLEYSVVTVPDHPGAMLSIAKDLFTSEEVSFVQSLHFNKSKFDTKEKCIAWAKQKKYKDKDIYENETSYIFVQKEFDVFDENSLSSIKLEDGVEIISGRFTKEIIDKKSPRIDKELVELLKACKPKKITKELGMCADNPGMKTEDIVKSVTEAVLKIIDTKFTEFDNKHTNAFNEFSKKFELPKTEVKQEVKAEAPIGVTIEQVNTTLNEFSKNLVKTIGEELGKFKADMDNKVKDISKSIVGVEEVREEEIKGSTKENKTEDKNDCLSSIFPFGRK
jgi:hypothetical protein